MNAATVVQRYREFLAGLQVIEREIMKGVKESGGQLAPGNFRWHRGKDFLPPPFAIELEITTPGRATVSVSFSMEEVVDSWDQLERGDVREKVARVVEELTKL